MNSEVRILKSEFRNKKMKIWLNSYRDSTLRENEQIFCKGRDFFRNNAVIQKTKSATAR